MAHLLPPGGSPSGGGQAADAGKFLPMNLQVSGLCPQLCVLKASHTWSSEALVPGWRLWRGESGQPSHCHAAMRHHLAEQSQHL